MQTKLRRMQAEEAEWRSLEQQYQAAEAGEQPAGGDEPEAAEEAAAEDTSAAEVGPLTQAKMDTDKTLQLQVCVQHPGVAAGTGSSCPGRGSPVIETLET